MHAKSVIFQKTLKDGSSWRSPGSQIRMLQHCLCEQIASLVHAAVLQGPSFGAYFCCMKVLIICGRPVHALGLSVVAHVAGLLYFQQHATCYG